MVETQPGQLFPANAASDYDALMFVIKQTLGLVRTATLVQVKAVSTVGDVVAVGTVDVLPLVNLLDGLGNASKHGIVYGIPYFRLQGGKNAIIIDPQIDDIGIAVFSDRDISSVKKNKAQSNPGSWRRFSFSDGIYLGGTLNGVPEQYVRFYGKGIDVVDKNKNTFNLNDKGIKITDSNSNIVEMTSDGVKITDKNGNIINMKSGSIDITGNLNVSGFVVAGNGSGDKVGLQTHKHTGVQSGGATTAAPVPGS